MPKYQFETEKPIISCLYCPIGKEYDPDGIPTGGFGCLLTYKLYNLPADRPDDCPLQEVE